MTIKEIFKEGEKGLQAYKNLIGVGVIFTLLLITGVFLMTYSQQSKISDQCGFDDGKIRCVCTENAWNTYQTVLSSNTDFVGDNLSIITKDLNTGNT